MPSAAPHAEFHRAASEEEMFIVSLPRWKYATHIHITYTVYNTHIYIYQLNKRLLWFRGIIAAA